MCMATLNDLVFDPRMASMVGDFLIETGSYKVNFENLYNWKSGIKSPTYCNCRDLTEDGRYSSRIGNFLAEVVEDQFSEADSIVSLAVAGLTWGSRVAQNLDLPFGYVRSVQKKHGIPKMVEGLSNDAKKVVIVDDLVAGGGSVVNAIEHLKKESDVEVLGVVSIVNWGFPMMKEKFDETDLKTRCLTSFPYIIGAAKRAGLVNNYQSEELNSFYCDPKGYDMSRLVKNE